MYYTSCICERLTLKSKKNTGFLSHLEEFFWMNLTFLKRYASCLENNQKEKAIR